MTLWLFFYIGIVICTTNYYLKQMSFIRAALKKRMTALVLFRFIILSSLLFRLSNCSSLIINNVNVSRPTPNN